MRNVLGFLLVAVFGCVIGGVALNTYLSNRVARDWFLPLDTGDRSNWDTVAIWSKGHFLAWRAAYGGMKVHWHTAVDLQNNGAGGKRGGPGEPVYPAAKGIVEDVRVARGGTRVSLRHLLPDGRTVWTSYIHVAEPTVQIGQWVEPSDPIARRFNRQELRRFGRIYNHVHFQIHKDRFHPKDTSTCYTQELARQHFYEPRAFFADRAAARDTVNWLAWLRDGRVTLAALTGEVKRLVVADWRSGQRGEVAYAGK